jgi:hypothetical protein
LAATIRKTQDDAITQNAADFRKNQAEYLQDRAPLLKQEAEKFGSTFELSAGGVKNAMLDLRDSVSSGVIGSFSKLNDILQQVNIQEDNRKKLLEQNNIKDKDGKTVGPIVGQVIDSLERFKIGIDDATAKSLPQIGQITKNLLSIQTILSDKFGNPEMMNTAVEKFTSLIKDLLGRLGPGGPQTGERGAAPNDPSSDGAAVIDAARNNVTALNQNTEALRNNNSVFGGFSNMFSDLVRLNEQGRPGGAPVSGPLTPAVQPNTAPSAPAVAPSGPPKLKAPVKPGQGTEKLTPETVAAVNAMYDLLGEKYGMQVTAGVDDFHKNKKGSLHPTGRAADIKFRKPGADYDEIRKQVNQMFKDRGIDAKVEVHKDETTKGANVLELSTPKKLTDEKRSAADEENNSLLARLVEIFEDHLAVAEESRDTLDILKRQMA